MAIEVYKGAAAITDVEATLWSVIFHSIRMR